MKYRLKHAITLTVTGAGILTVGILYGAFAAPADGVVNQYESLIAVGLIAVGLIMAGAAWLAYAGDRLRSMVERHMTLPDTRAFRMNVGLQSKLHAAVTRLTGRGHHGKITASQKTHQME